MAAPRSIKYRLDGAEVTLQVDQEGAGPAIVFLPALSSISTRTEMRPLMDRLAPDFRTVTTDWPGFGDLPRPRADWTPDILSDFLSRFMNENAPQARAIVAAAHAASYALHEVAYHPRTVDRLVLIAPTWRGPLPTMVNGYRPWFSHVRAAVDQPLAGPLLYRLNISRPLIGRMAREHVYSDPAWLSGERLAAKRAVTRPRGARHGSVRFVTGGLDRVGGRVAFLDLARRAGVPMLVLYGDETSPKSRAEMEALADVPKVRIERLPRGKLSIHEEFPDDVAAVVGPFLKR